MPVSVGLAYLDNSQQPGTGSSNCLFGFLIVTILLVIWLAHCLITCGPEGEPLDQACMWRCWRRFFILEGLALVFLFACLLAPYIL